MKSSLTKIFMCLGFISLVLTIPALKILASGPPPSVGAPLPAVILPAPDNANDKGYLGLSGAAPFKIPQVKANVVIIEIFSMYCPYCQREAPLLNDLYGAIEGDPGLKGKIKLLGIGAGNSAFEVDVFKKNYNIPFPLFPDEDFKAHKQLGETRTPYFIVIKNNEDGSHRVIYSKLGGIQAVETFLKRIMELSGLEKGGAK
ncbi:MAG: TlpA disulfide reductase family protein [Pseudomonadota bacterium]